MEYAENVNEMFEELQKNPIFLPSNLWKGINIQHSRMINEEGIENFKRTVSQNYYNWLITKVLSPIFINVFFRWLLHPNLRPFQSKIEKDIKLYYITNVVPDVKSRSVILSRWKRYIYMIFVGFIWEAMLNEDHDKLSNKVSEPELGNPIHIWQNNKLITQDIANSIIECNLISSLNPQPKNRQKIAELGAGSGRLAQVYMQTQQGKYCIFDIPPALNISEWYLSNVFSDKTIFHFRSFDKFEDIREELEKSDICFFTANQLKKFPEGYFDVVISISNLPEMTTEQVNLYLILFQKVSGAFIFLKQWKYWKNDIDGTVLGMNDYINNKDWSLKIDKEDPINPQFFNRVWQLTSNRKEVL